jgi:hypothetical protein
LASGGITAIYEDSAARCGSGARLVSAASRTGSSCP